MKSVILSVVLLLSSLSAVAANDCEYGKQFKVQYQPQLGEAVQEWTLYTLEYLRYYSNLVFSITGPSSFVENKIRSCVVSQGWLQASYQPDVLSEVYRRQMGRFVSETPVKMGPRKFQLTLKTNIDPGGIYGDEQTQVIQYDARTRIAEVCSFFSLHTPGVNYRYSFSCQYFRLSRDNQIESIVKVNRGATHTRFDVSLKSGASFTSQLSNWETTELDRAISRQRIPSLNEIRELSFHPEVNQRIDELLAPYPIGMAMGK